MLGYKKAVLLLSILTVAVWAIGSTFQDQKLGPQLNKKPTQIDKSKWPVAEYDALKPNEADKSFKRQERGKKYNKSNFEVNPSSVSDESFLTHSDTASLPAIPVAQSDAVVLGIVSDTHAYLSEDKTGVYSEFTIIVDDVIKSNPGPPITQGSLITIQREGGRVTFPSGRTHLYSVSGENMPGVGQRYVLFLKLLDEEKLFNLLTAYALQEGKVIPLDENRQFKAHKGVSEKVFLNTVRETATNSLQIVND